MVSLVVGAVCEGEKGTVEVVVVVVIVEVVVLVVVAEGTAGEVG